MIDASFSISPPSAELPTFHGICTAVFLEINGIQISRASSDGVYDLVVHVAAGHPTVEEIAERLQQLAA